MPPELPGGPVPEWQLFQEKVHQVDGKPKVMGFSDPNGHYFTLLDGEELVHILAKDGVGRDTFIRTDGALIPFEAWKEGK